MEELEFTIVCQGGPYHGKFYPAGEKLADGEGLTVVFKQTPVAVYDLTDETAETPLGTARVVRYREPTTLEDLQT